MSQSAKSLLEIAKKEGVERVQLHALVQNGDEVLLVEEKPIYSGVMAIVEEDESITQALQRSLMEKLGKNLLEVKGYLGHQDEEKVRDLAFVVTIDEPYEIEMTHAWVRPEDGVGYPITDRTRELLDLYMKFTLPPSP